MANELYTVRSALGGYRIIKFDFLLNVECVYWIAKGRTCDCFRAKEFSCKHRRMLALFLEYERVNKGYFYCYDTEEWQLPLTEQYKRVRNRFKIQS